MVVLVLMVLEDKVMVSGLLVLYGDGCDEDGSVEFGSKTKSVVSTRLPVNSYSVVSEGVGPSLKSIKSSHIPINK